MEPFNKMILDMGRAAAMFGVKKPVVVMQAAMLFELWSALAKGSAGHAVREQRFHDFRFCGIRFVSIETLEHEQKQDAK